MPTANHQPPLAKARRVGLIAGWGRLPITVANSLRAAGHEVQCLGLKWHCEEGIRPHVDHFEWLNAARLGDAIRYFRRRGVSQATMCGKFHKVDLYRPWAWFRYVPDSTFLKTFYPHFIGRRGDRRDDTLLGTFVRAFADAGVEFLPATDFAPELLVKAGTLAGAAPTAAQLADLEFGWRIAKQMGGLDIGQSICVKDRAVIAVEAIEGTDESIRRAGELCKQGGFTVIKVAKPKQDMRFDVPTVGVRTLQTMADAGAKVLAIEAGQTILLDDRAFRDFAKRRGLRVVAIDMSRHARHAA
ncbi:MAG: UDP-2,3-diacylglucosamine diphosphatase LpxI [Planctomycetota bacterium]